MRKKIALFLTLCATVCTTAGMLTGCKSQETAGTEGQAAAPAEGTAAESSGGGSAEGEEEVVTIFHHIGEQAARDALDRVIAAVEEQNPGIKYEAQGIDFSQYDQMLKTKLASGDVPDLIMGRPKMYADLIAAGHIEPLTGQSFLSNISQEAMSSMEVNGEVYAIPTNVGGMGIFYNKAVFEENGVEIPKSHAELMEAGKKFEEAGIYPFAHGYKDAWPAQCEVQSDLYGYCLQQNPKMFEEIQAGQKKFADYPEFREVMVRTGERLSFESGDDFGTDCAQARAMLINGEAAMYVGGNWDIVEFINVNADDKIGFFATPNTSGSEPVQGLASDGCYMILSQSEHKEAAMKFIEFLSTPEGAMLTNTDGSNIPCSLEGDLSNLSPIVQDIIEIQKNGKVYNYEAEPIFTGQFDATFRKWQEEFAADPDRDVDTYIEKLDAQLAAIK